MKLKYFTFGEVNGSNENGMVSAKSSEDAIKLWIKLQYTTLSDAMGYNGVKHFPELVKKMEKDMIEVPHDEALNKVVEKVADSEERLDSDMQTSVADLYHDFNNVSGVLYINK